ncbi:MAG: hypothetical protein IKW90_08210 [Lachnospiraceae bacterium]|nr:hypothetical protein [Lachnospiraceae bacterium]
MFNGLKMVVGGMMVAGFVAAASAFGIKASDNTLIADLDGNGTEEIVSYDENIDHLENGDINYSFKFTIEGKTVYKEGGLIERYPEVTEEGRLHDKLDHLKTIAVSVADINPGKEGKELIAKYYADVDDIVLGYKVFRYNDGKLNVVSEFYPNASHSYIPTAQADNKYIKVNVEEYIDAIGKVWITRTYKLTKNGFVEKENKSGKYNVAPARYEENKLTKYVAANCIEMFSDSSCLVDYSIGMLQEGEKFVIKKIIFPTEYNGNFISFAYIKTASGLKGWIMVDNTIDEMGQPVNAVAVK